jgi:group II intron reverse transcriptase/maturase
MRTANTILEIIRERGRRGLPLERIYRLLFNRELYLLAYGRLYRNRGAMTPGSTPETVDGMSLAKIDALIEAVRFERHRWTPVRRVNIPKPNGKTRPLGIPTWSDKLLQEVIRLLLEAYFEPQFSEHSHGFRPGVGCHTAFREIHRTWTGTKWFIEGDISACFDSLDHQVLLAILRETFHDGRFIRLIENLLTAGYLEDWKFNATLSGTPQGGVVSPILSNIYLDRLDKFVETVLLPAYNRGSRRRDEPTYKRMLDRARYLGRTGRRDEALPLRRQLQQMPSRDPNDPDYRRLRYVRYADDFLLGFSGPQSEAEDIKAKLRAFLRDDLKLELSEAKTLITHARTGAARFLGYEVVVIHDDHQHGQSGQRTFNGTIGLKVPADVVHAKCKPYLRHGKPIHRVELTNHSVFSIVAQYHQKYVGIVEYYRLAYNLHRLTELQWVMETSLTKTLSCKLRISVNKVYKRFRASIATPAGTKRVLMVTVERGKEKAPLVAQWGNVSLARRADAVLNDHPQPVWNVRTELLERLLADTCELCGSTVDIEVHHIRALKDLQPKGRAAKPEWAKLMAARHRKTLVVCHDCHGDIHAGRSRVTGLVR